MFSVCKVCGFEETANGNGDVEWCDECFSVEQGFLYLEEYDHCTNCTISGNNCTTIYADEDGLLYEDGNLLKPIGSIYEL